MPQSPAAEIVLVRAVEESRPELIPPERLIDAFTTAGDLDEDVAWLSRRASYLLDTCLAGYQSLVAMGGALGRGTFAALLLPLIIGLASNYLGPSARIHVIFNPITFLVTWNLIVYLWLVTWGLGRRRGSAPTSSIMTAKAAGDAPRPAVDAPARMPQAPVGRAGPFARWAIRRVVPNLWLRFRKSAGDARTRAKDITAVGRQFWTLWIPLNGRAMALNLRRLVHLAAVGIAIGAVVGMYARGLFFEYNVVWRSTFIRDPETVALILQGLLGPAAIALGESFPETKDAVLLMTEEGLPAATWIHLYAASAVGFIMLPRLFLASIAGLRARAAARTVQLDLDADYYQRLLDVARKRQVQLVEDRIGADVRAASEEFTDTVANFVCEQLYDDRIVPLLEQFRMEGGDVGALKDAISIECDVFRSDLASYVPVAQHDFERSLAQRIERTVAARLSVLPVPSAGLATKVGATFEDSARGVGGAVGHRLADLISGAVSAAVAATMGAISGGFGEALGTSVLVGLIGTTGPIGFVIGALGGFLGAGAIWWLGRERLAASMSRLRLPKPIARLALLRFQGIIEKGREECRRSVKQLMAQELEPLTPTIAEQIWVSVKPVLGEQQREGALLEEHAEPEVTDSEND